MDAASHTFPGVQDSSPQIVSNGSHQIPPPHDQGNGGPVRPNTCPYSCYQDASGDPSSSTDDSGIQCHARNIMVTTQPHAARPNYVLANVPGHHHLQNGQSHMQPFASIYLGFGGQQPARNSNGLVHNSGNCNCVNGQMADNHCIETFNVCSQNGQSNNILLHKNGTPQPFHGVNPKNRSQIPDTHRNKTFHVPVYTGHNGMSVAHSEAPPKYSSPYVHQNPPHPTAPHHPVQSGVNILPLPVHGEQQAITRRPNPDLDATYNGVGNHHPGSWGLHPYMDQNPLAANHRSGLLQSPNQFIAHDSMHKTNVEHLNQGVQTGSPRGYQTGAVIPPEYGPPLFTHDGAPAPDLVYENPSMPGYRVEVNVGPRNSQTFWPNAQEPGFGTAPHPNPSYGGFNMSQRSNVMGSNVQTPNGMDARVLPNVNCSSFQDKQPQNPIHGGCQPADNQNTENTGGQYVGQHLNEIDPVFQNGVAPNSALGFHPPNTSNAPYTEGLYHGPRPKTAIGSNDITHGMIARLPPAQHPASAPAPTTFLNGQPRESAFYVHSLQDSMLGRPPGPNAPIVGGVARDTYPMGRYIVPGHISPANSYANGNGTGLPPAYVHVNQLHTKVQKNRGITFIMDDGVNQKIGVPKRRQPRKPRGKGVNVLGPPALQLNRLLALQPNGLPALQPNGRAQAPMSFKMRPELSPAPQDSSGSAPHVNGSHQENGTHMYPVMPRGGNGSAPPNPPALQPNGLPALQPIECPQAPTARPAPYSMTNNAIDAPVTPNHDMDIVTNLNDIPWGLTSVPLPPYPFDDLPKTLHTGRKGMHEENTERPGDLFDCASLAHSMPFDSPHKSLANRAAVIMQQDQPKTVRMSDIQPDTDAHFRKRMGRIEQEEFPELPGQTQWSLWSSSTHDSTANFRSKIVLGGGGKRSPGGGEKMAVGNLHVSAVGGCVEYYNTCIKV